ncbi:DoxX family protein [Deinococcus yavapaiensis]|uniref:Thiosulfate dehydrogenase [quinone] large subunit n=1 Tax=Deinococcus yavapaiensis KR-236 TaxID=694435 RepID=A0A318S0B6_9DEIO|nr:DoxX family membrane protein [Deinococcus yavapaiensis]PYE48398.1 thiosulfate dehydrogenase [quinone] large subunit [Deinococcus yavapaiensis KR-236]
MLTADVRRTTPKFDLSRFTFANARTAPLWALLRVYVGYEWLTAGLHKASDPNGVWIGAKAGVAVGGFLKGALAKTAGDHPDVQGWYASFIQNFALPNATLFSYLVTFGEIAVGLALILGLFTAVAAFFGGFMNVAYLLAGTVSTNPVLFVLATWLVLAWRVAGYLGLDYFVLPRLGFKTPSARPKDN